MLTPLTKVPVPHYTVTVKPRLRSVVRRPTGKVIRRQLVGLFALLVTKTADEFIIVEARTGLRMAGSNNLKVALKLSEKLTAVGIRTKLAELPNLLNLYKRQVYECL